MVRVANGQSFLVRVSYLNITLPAISVKVVKLNEAINYGRTQCRAHLLGWGLNQILPDV